MRHGLIVENNAAWLEDFKRTLTKELREDFEPLGFNLVPEALSFIRDGGGLDSIDLAFVDLELGKGDEPSSPGDLDGRDCILRELRAEAPWIPVVLISRYLTGDPLVLSEVSPYGFDAVLPKKFFSESRTYKQQWQRVRELAALNRVSALTGRAIHKIIDLSRSEWKVECGSGVQQEIDKYNNNDFMTALRLMDFESERVVMDDVVQGFSGLSVVRVRCKRGTASISWLLKFGELIGKLNRESRAHRRMFVDGLTRHMSVPMLWWRPVVWKSVGMIAYEFEDNALTLLDEARRLTLGKALPRVRDALRELYKGSDADTVIPRRVFAAEMKNLDCSWMGGRHGALLLALDRDERNEELDNSVRVLRGPQHGDLHSRNLLLNSERAFFIDFAHYRGLNEGGLPLLDIAKLFIDLWAFLDELELSDILSAKILTNEPYHEIASPALLEVEPTEDERRLFRLATIFEVAKYREYKDVPDAKRKEVEELLRRA